ncbi:MAG: ribose-phosphate diphosphokinase [Spirulinaceae cyanobacterium]
MSGNLTLLSGTANPVLARAIASYLNLSLGAIAIAHHPDGEVAVQLQQSVKNHPVVIIQPTSPPVDCHLIELLAIADACRRAGASQLTAIMPYFGYGRSDKRRPGEQQPIMARLVAQMLETAGINRIITVDPHAPQLTGFFHIPIQTLSAVSVLSNALKPHLRDNLIVVSPDSGGISRAVAFSQHLNTEIAILHKQRQSDKETRVTNLMGDVAGKTCLIVDDMISTGGTLANAIAVLKDAGANPEVIVAATHGLFVQNARQNLDNPSLQRIFVTDTIPQQTENWPQLEVVSLASMIAQAIDNCE